jgi:hypothetical protein
MAYSGDANELQAMLEGRSPVVPAGPNYSGGRPAGR